MTLKVVSPEVMGKYPSYLRYMDYAGPMYPYNHTTANSAKVGALCSGHHIRSVILLRTASCRWSWCFVLRVKIISLQALGGTSCRFSRGHGRVLDLHDEHGCAQPSFLVLVGSKIDPVFWWPKSTRSLSFWRWVFLGPTNGWFQSQSGWKSPDWSWSPNVLSETITSCCHQTKAYGRTTAVFHASVHGSRKTAAELTAFR